MPEKWKSAALTPRSKDNTKNSNLDHQETNEKISTNNKQNMNSTSKSNSKFEVQTSNTSSANTNSATGSTNSQQVNNAYSNNGSGNGQKWSKMVKKPSLKIKHREKLDTTLLRLLALLPNSAEPLDASNLLENSTKNGQKRPKRCSRVGQKTPDYSENH